MENDLKIINIDGDEGELLQNTFKRSFARYNGYVIYDELNEYVDSVLNMDIKDDDVWVCSYPKTVNLEKKCSQSEEIKKCYRQCDSIRRNLIPSKHALTGLSFSTIQSWFSSSVGFRGTTWTQEMVYCVANDFDLEKTQEPLNDRYVFLDKCFLIPKKMSNLIESELKRIKNLLSCEPVKSNQVSRFIHTHLPYELLPKKLRDGSTNAKIIYVVRNPRDTSISSYHHMSMIGRYDGSLKNYCEFFMKGLVTYGPYWKHLLAYWNKRNDKSLFFIKYEDMKKDLPSVIRKTASFLEKSVTDEQMEPLCQHLSFESMKNNRFINEKPLIKILKNNFNPAGEGEFFRKGKADQWKNEFEPELIDRFEQWEYENLKHLNLTYADL